MNKLVAGLGTVIVLLSVVCGVLYCQMGDVQLQKSELLNQVGQLENQVSELELHNSELQNQTSEQEAQIRSFMALVDISKLRSLVRITEITFGSAGPYIGLTMCSAVNVTVQNFGPIDLEGLNLSVRESSKATSTMYTVQVGLLKAGEAKKVRTNAFWTLDSKEHHFDITLTLDDAILDYHHH